MLGSGALGFGEEGGVLGFGSVKENLAFRDVDLRVRKGDLDVPRRRSCRREELDASYRLSPWIVTRAS